MVKKAVSGFPTMVFTILIFLKNKLGIEQTTHGQKTYRHDILWTENSQTKKLINTTTYMAFLRQTL